MTMHEFLMRYGLLLALIACCTTILFMLVVSEALSWMRHIRRSNEPRLPEPHHTAMRHNTVDDWITSHGKSRWTKHTEGYDSE